MQRVVTKNFGIDNVRRLYVAKEHGAYTSLEKLFAMTPEQVVDEVSASGLRGRGGAGFSTGKKWGFVPREAGTPVYLVVNADESEPGTFKDRAIVEHDPHLLIEGIIIAAYAIGADTVYAYFRGEYHHPWRTFVGALDEALEAGLFTTPRGRLAIHTHRGAGSYICGEETALLNSIEGMRGVARIRPPFPATQGLFGCPTIVNNVETLAALPFIIREGAKSYRAMGTSTSAGTKLISACGHINKPGVYEIEMGTPVATFLAEQCKGTLEERALKAIIPGGPSVPVLTAAEGLGARLDYESMEEAGSQLGAGGFIVMDETANMPRVLLDIARFFDHESCGRCTLCREGSGWIHKICRRIVCGTGRSTDIDLLFSIASDLPGRSICVFADAMAQAVTSFITKFKDEFEYQVHCGKTV